MGTERWRDARATSWRCALTACVTTVAACSVAGSSAGRLDEPDAVPTTPPIQASTAWPVADYGTVDGEGRRVATGRDAPAVEVGFRFGPDAHPGPAVLLFEPVSAPVHCITGARLDLTLSEAVRTPIAVYPGDPASVVAADGTEVPGWATLLDNRPRGTLDVDESTGTASADVTDLVRTWTAGGPFPSRGRTVEPTQPLVLVVQPEAATGPATFGLSTTGSGLSNAPALTVATSC